MVGDGFQSPGEGESGSAAEKGEQKAFSDHLADEAEAAGADTEADREFSAAAGAARQRHRGEIEAGNGDNDGHHGGVEAENFGADVAGNLHAGSCAEQNDTLRFIGLGWCEGIVFIQTARDSVERGLGGVDGNAGREAHQELEIFGGGVVEDVAGEFGRDRGGDSRGEISAGLGFSAPSNFRGVTPTMVAVCPLRRIVWPITAGSALKRLCQ